MNKISENYKQTATDFFKQGYNCAQSVVLTFSDLLDIDDKTLAMLASPFGGGMGGMREVCGAVSGMFMVLGLLEGYSQPKDYEEKKKLYEKVQKLASEFKAECGAIRCGDLLSMQNGNLQSAPSKRDEQYYKKRPCAEITGIAAGILANYLFNKD